MPDNVNVVDDIKAEDKAEGDIKENVVTTMTVSRPPAARSQQGLSGTEKMAHGSPSRGQWMVGAPDKCFVIVRSSDCGQIAATSSRF
jgi:hypothetical protein